MLLAWKRLKVSRKNRTDVSGHDYEAQRMNESDSFKLTPPAARRKELHPWRKGGPKTIERLCDYVHRGSGRYFPGKDNGITAL